MDSNDNIPKKLIKNEQMLATFLKGKTFEKIINFVILLQKTVESKNRLDTKLSPVQ